MDKTEARMAQQNAEIMALSAVVIALITEHPQQAALLKRLESTSALLARSINRAQGQAARGTRPADAEIAETMQAAFRDAVDRLVKSAVALTPATPTAH